jgi:hypothetical protein
MFSIGVNFFPGSPQTLANIQVIPTPEVWRDRQTGLPGDGIVEEFDQLSPILDEQGGVIAEE